VGNPRAIPGGSPAEADARSAEVPASVMEGIARICALGLALPELLDQACRELVALAGADVGYLAHLGTGEDRGRVRRFSSPGDWPDLTGEYRAISAREDLLAGLRAHGTLSVADVSDLPPDHPARSLFVGVPRHSLLIVPLRFGTSLTGLVGLHSYAGPRRWSAGERRLVEAVALVLSAALQRRRMEEDLRASEARYRFLADNAPDVISLHDASGTCRYVSPASGRMLGYRPEEMVGCAGDAFLHPDDREAMGEAHRRLVAGEIPAVTIPHRLRTREGGFREVETVASAVPDGRGEVRQVLRVTRDVTERKETESRAFESRRLETVGLLAGGVAHEFNNLLVGIHGTVEMLSLLLAGNEEAGKYLAIIERLGNRAVELTRQLLAYARQGPLSPRVLSLSRLVAEEVPVLRAALPSSVEIVMEPDEGSPYVLADPIQVKQVVMTLCLNASEAMPAGGTLTLRTRREDAPPDGPRDATRRAGRGIERRVSSGGDRRGAWSVVEVSDTGRGMDAATVARIFEPFYSTKFIGRGMGLAAVRGIVETHGGAVTVRSEVGSGTTFAVAFPAAEVRPPGEERPEEVPAPGRGTILVADDEEDVRSVVRAMLESLGYSVLEARDGREAVDLFRERRTGIDLVLLDMMMPGMTGAEAFAEMRRISPMARGLLASGYNVGGEREVAESGFEAFLQKPFRRSELGRQIGRALRNAPPPRASNGD
jgi:two-component system, cell cycle sensor histidine kinase and response regulator CckA